MRPDRGRYGLLWVGIVFVLLGCNAGPDVTPAPATDSVTLQLQWVTQAQFAGYYVALEKGWFAEVGIDLTILPGGPDISPVERVALGTAEFGTALLSDLAVQIQEGRPLISIAQIQQKNGLMLVTRTDSGITSPSDFVGKRVGVWLGSWEAQFNALLAQAGLSQQDFDLVSQGYSMDTFLSGDLDVASAMVYNEYQTVLESGVPAGDLRLIDYADFGLDFPGDTLFTRRDLWESNPDLCRRMLAASLRGWEYAVAYPSEAADIVLRYDASGVQTREHQLAMMREIANLVQVSVRPLGYTDRGDVLRMVDNLATFGILPERLEPEEIFTNDVWDQVQNLEN
ncbi:MAG: ABC transporter substrate-binding protein [Anaerolineae bacterium]|nr:ABC transporter substrate-binding protein [Anaerolineae bacterium]